jgi:hypothetical protein
MSVGLVLFLSSVHRRGKKVFFFCNFVVRCREGYVGSLSYLYCLLLIHLFSHNKRFLVLFNQRNLSRACWFSLLSLYCLLLIHLFSHNKRFLVLFNQRILSRVCWFSLLSLYCLLLILLEYCIGRDWAAATTGLQPIRVWGRRNPSRRVLPPPSRR